MARTNPSDCSATLRLTVGCEPGLPKVLLSFCHATLATATKCTEGPAPGQHPEREQLLVHAAPAGEEAGDGAGRGQEVGYAYVLVGGVRQPHVARAVHDAGHPAEVDKEAHVRAVGNAFDGRLLPGYPFVGPLQGLADGGPGLALGGRERAPEPPEFRGMPREPRIPPRHILDALGYKVLESIYFFAGDQAHPTLGDERLGHGGGPVAGLDDAHVDGHL